MNADERIGAYVVESENFESIHNHPRTRSSSTTRIRLWFDWLKFACGYFSRLGAAVLFGDRQKRGFCRLRLAFEALAMDALGVLQAADERAQEHPVESQLTRS